jgi:hypothetical protein
MLFACIFSGFASTMNMWIDKWDDFFFSLNDLFMTGMMTGWMFFFMGLFSLDIKYIIFGILLGSIFFILIRKQAFITEIEYLRGMIPHHSMAIMMSKRLENKPHSIQQLVKQIIDSQEKEIFIMKKYLAGADDEEIIPY